jgi:hypothetical protein
MSLLEEQSEYSQSWRALKVLLVIALNLVILRHSLLWYFDKVQCDPREGALSSLQYHYQVF